MVRTYQPKKLQKERAWLQKENGYQKRSQSSRTQKSKRQKTADLLIGRNGCETAFKSVLYSCGFLL